MAKYPTNTKLSREENHAMEEPDVHKLKLKKIVSGLPDIDMQKLNF